MRRIAAFVQKNPLTFQSAEQNNWLRKFYSSTGDPRKSCHFQETFPQVFASHMCDVGPQ